MTEIHIIKGRITLSANLIAAAIKRSGRYDYRVRTHTHQICEIEFFQKGESVGVVTFTMDDAKRAGLAGNENWKKYPANMLFARALSNGAKFHCPDVFGGPVYTPDEIEPRSRIDPETGDMLCPTPPPAPEVKLLPPDRGPEGTSLGEDAHARVSALVEETGTDLSRFLAHYRVTSIQDLTLEQCSEAIDVLIARKDSNPTSVS